MEVPIWLKDFFDLLTSPVVQQELFPIKVVFMLFSLVFFIGIVYFMFNSTFIKYQAILDFTTFFKLESPALRKIIKRWKKIQKRMDVGSEYEYKLAIMEAEELFNNILIDKGFSGKTFEERLKEVEKIQLPNVDEIFRAHKLRNTVAHDPNYRIEKDEAKKILEIYENGIKSIESF